MNIVRNKLLQWTYRNLSGSVLGISIHQVGLYSRSRRSYIKLVRLRRMREAYACKRNDDKRNKDVEDEEKASMWDVARKCGTKEGEFEWRSENRSIEAEWQATGGITGIDMTTSASYTVFSYLHALKDNFVPMT